MAKVILICAAMIVIAGCVNADYHNRTYAIVDGKPVLTGDKQIHYASCNVNIQTIGLDVSSPNDVRIIMGKRILVADPNSAIAIGHAVADGLTGGAASWPEILK